ncbi:MAG: CocE/NonD family hydrolase [Saccharospirillum sp.]|uniref:CocE/NonD family hydrolase n=1 Tax=Saccharospirillum sp. TaxID=2033801 RepID=UPI003297BEDF
MKLYLVAISLILITLIGLAGYYSTSLKQWLSDTTMPMRKGVHVSRNVMVPMSDGINLATDVYRPTGSGGRFPVIMMRTTYGGVPFNDIKQFVDHDYAVVVQHVRGRYNSQGRFNSPYRDSAQDGYNTIDWIVSQSWATDKVGTFGCSYLGESQIILAARNHPNHVAMIASGAGGAIGKAKDAYGYFGVFENGVLNLASSLGWFTAEGAKDFNTTPRSDDYEERMRTYMNYLPVSEIAEKVAPYETGFDDIISHPLTDSWWDEEGYTHPNDQFSVATLHINDWFDQTAHNAFRLAQHMAENARTPTAKSQHVLIAPGTHCEAEKLRSGKITVGEMPFYYDARDFGQIYLNWFDHWLKQKPSELPPKYEYYTVHAGSWNTSDQWPPKSATEVVFRMQPGNRLERQSDLSSEQDTGQTYDEFSYDPMDPVPTLGGPICCTYRPEDRAGVLDQRPLKSRQDVLVYTSKPLEEDLTITGNPSVVLHVSTSAPDTDFTVKMVDQYPDGRAYGLQDGVVRLRYRNGVDQPSLVTPGQIYQIKLEMRPLAYVFKAGHRIEFHVSSSNFPRLVRNLNTGKDEYSDSEIFVAKNRVHLSGDSPSYVTLPVTRSGDPL